MVRPLILLVLAAGISQQGLPPRPSVAPGPNLSDLFSGNMLDPSWQLHNPHLMRYWVQDGELHLEATAAGAPASWFADFEGPLIYKSVSGDFDVIASVRAWSTSNPSQPPPVPFRLGGIIARDPGSVSGNRNSVHVVVGAGDAGRPVSAEDKTTLSSQSDWILYPQPQAAGQVRIRRSGSLFDMFYRASRQEPWTLLRSHDRPDLPTLLHVGPMVYSNGTPADITVSFDEVLFR